MSAASDQRRPGPANRAHSSSFDVWPIGQSGATKLTVVFGYMLANEFLTAAAATFSGSLLYHYILYGYISFGALPTPKMYIGESVFIAAILTIISLASRHFEMAQKQQMHVF